MGATRRRSGAVVQVGRFASGGLLLTYGPYRASTVGRDNGAVAVTFSLLIAFIE
jgi:hypothetical protein